MDVRRSPIRTCVGCRQRAVATELLRVVAADSAPGQPVVVPDPRHRMSGRGAWLHPDPACIELAERRRAFARALRVPVAVDPEELREVAAERRGSITPYDSSTSGGNETGIPAGGIP